MTDRAQYIEPTMHEAKELYIRLLAVPAMPHRGPSRERLTILLAALKQAYDQGRAFEAVYQARELP